MVNAHLPLQPIQHGTNPLHRHSAALGVCGVGERRQAKQEEGELKGPPRAVVWFVRIGDGLAQRQVGANAAIAHRHGVYTLAGHNLIGETESLESIGVAPE